MASKEDLQRAHDDGQIKVAKPIKNIFVEHFSTKRDLELDAAWRKGAANTDKQRNS